MDTETILLIICLLGSLFFFRSVFDAFESREIDLYGECGGGINFKRRENPIGFYITVLFEIFFGAVCLIIAFGLFFEDGKKDGPYETYYENGQLEYKGSYKDGELDGLFETYYENGELRSKLSYKNGEWDGPWEYYYENGNLKERVSYKDGEQEGLFEYYDKDGKSSSKKTYKDGELISEENF